jgi:Novel STAND NTPase 1
MTNTTIEATVAGGKIQGVGVAGTVHIENFTIYNRAVEEPAVTDTAGEPIAPCPYPGLAYFGPGDANLFFGRDAAITRLSEAVGRQSLTALVGASGSGKSSVVLAGLAPRLAAGGDWAFSYFRVGTETDKDPFVAAARALVPLFFDGASPVDRLREIGNLANRRQSGEIALGNVLGECRRQRGKRILLIADQFEEVFTLIGDEGVRQRFIDALLSGFASAGAASSPPACLLLTLRADFYNMVLRYRPLSDAIQGHVENLGPMTRDELREAIKRPAGDVVYEQGLVDTLLDDVAGRPGNLPLLQFALREMWLRQKAGHITHKAYQDIGRVEGALARRAHEIFEKITKGGNDEATVTLFRRLFTRMLFSFMGRSRPPSH